MLEAKRNVGLVQPRHDAKCDLKQAIAQTHFLLFVWRQTLHTPRQTTVVVDDLATGGQREGTTGRSKTSSNYFAAKDVLAQFPQDRSARQVRTRMAASPLARWDAQLSALLGDRPTAREEVCKILVLLGYATGVPERCSIRGKVIHSHDAAQILTATARPRELRERRTMVAPFSSFALILTLTAPTASLFKSLPSSHVPQPPMLFTK